jgi:hypothetical protein
LIERSSAKMASNFPTASKAIGEIVVGFPLRGFEAISASSNSLRLACAQHPASVIGPCVYRKLDSASRPFQPI